jgi:hypothetical protein
VINNQDITAIDGTDETNNFLKYAIAGVVLTCCLVGFCIVRRGRKNKLEKKADTPYNTWMANEEAKNKGEVRPQFAGAKAAGINPEGHKIEDLHLVFEEDMADVYGGAEGQEEPGSVYEANDENSYDDLYGADTSVPIYDDQQGFTDESGYDNEQYDETYAGEYDINGQSTHNPVYDAGDMYDDQSVGADSTVSAEQPRLDASRGAVRKAALFNPIRFKAGGDPALLHSRKASLADIDTQSTHSLADDKFISAPKPQLPVIDGKKALFNPIRFKAGGYALDKTENYAAPPQPPKQLLKKNIFNPIRFKSGEDQVEEVSKPVYDKGDLQEAPSIDDDITPPSPARTLVGVYNENGNRTDSPAKPKTIAPLRSLLPKSPAQAPMAPVGPERPTQFKALVPSTQVFKPKAAAGEVVAAQEGQFPVRMKPPVAVAPVPAARARRTAQTLDESIKVADFNL